MEGADILLAVKKQIVEPDKGGMAFQLLGRNSLAVETLLQIAESADLDSGIDAACDEQFAVERALETHEIGNIGKGMGDIIAGARIDTALSAFRGQLHANAVPLPLGGIFRLH